MRERGHLCAVLGSFPEGRDVGRAPGVAEGRFYCLPNSLIGGGEAGGDLALLPGNEQQDMRKGPQVVPWMV